MQFVKPDKRQEKRPRVLLIPPSTLPIPAVQGGAVETLLTHLIRENERLVLKNGAEVDLTPKEFDLYVFFVKHPRQVFTRLALLEEIWGYDYLGDTRTVDIHVQRLRKKLDLSSSVQTVFGVGYKYVPKECYTGNGANEQCYQYTVLDEATRKRYIRAYKEQSQESTIDFTLRAFRYFGYKPKEIQTDNGQEFRFMKMQTKDGRIHKFDKLCIYFGIKHKTIRPRTPRHNGKVERSHRNDNERFYRYLRYYSFEDLQKQMSVYLTRSNNIPSCVLRSSEDKRRWLSPNEKERELLKDT